MEKCWRTLAGRVINAIRPLMFANLCLLKLESYPPPETGKHTRVLAFLMIAFQRNGSQVLEKKTVLDFRRFTSQRGRNGIYNGKVFVCLF